MSHFVTSVPPNPETTLLAYSLPSQNTSNSTMLGAYQARRRVSKSLFLLFSGAERCHQPYQKFLRRYTTKTDDAIENLLLRRIRATGPISFATYMRTCLTLPEYGYYSNPENPIFGSRGDFITSPEISQVFGELIGVWFVSQWHTAGSPQSVRVIELGPGRGTLMDDILRVVSRFTQKANEDTRIEAIHLVETSEHLRSIQESKLSPYGTPLHFHNTLRSISPSKAFSMVVAHEYFDALPFNLLHKSEQGKWLEVLVSSTDDLPQLDASYKPPDTAASSSAAASQHLPFYRVLSAKPTAASLSARLSPGSADLPVGASLEVSVDAYQQSYDLAKLIQASNPAVNQANNTEHLISGGGCGLIIDYGDAKSFGNSFRAFNDHKIVDVFQHPGRSDLTVNVNFSLIQEALGHWVTTHGPIIQADFLNSMGLSLRAKRLQETARTEERRDAIRSAAERLVDPMGMGKEYKFLGFTSFPREEANSRETFPFPVAKT